MNVWVPKPILTQVRVLLLDPLTAKVGYRALSGLITKLLTEWLEEQKIAMKTKDTP